VHRDAVWRSAQRIALGAPSPFHLEDDMTHASTAQAASDAIETRDAWNDIATGYDRFVTPTHLWLGTEALRRVKLGAGMHFLDVAAGSGALSIPAARIGARVLSTDISPVMLDQLVTRARGEGLHVETRVMDGHALELDDESFDVAGSQFGVMLFPDLPRGVRELTRVTRRGGRVVLVAYGAPEQVEFLRVFLGAVHAVVPDFTGLPDDPPPLPFQVADPEKLRRELTDAGLTNVSVETIIETLKFSSGAQMWDWVVNSNPIGRMIVADLSEDQRASVRRVLDDMLRGRADGNASAKLTNPINIGIGTR
jgi:ubiquinone/menaquinone biosynthesis C-methylase UbiE